MKKIKVTCISTCHQLRDNYTPGKVYTMTVGKGVIIAKERRIQSNSPGIMDNFHVQRVKGDNHRYCVSGFDDVVFDAMPHRFRKVNRSAAVGQVEIDYSRCKRSIRNQARNVAKELYSCGKLEKIARSYGK